MQKGTVIPTIAAVLALVAATGVHAQAANLFDLVQNRTATQVQAAIAKGADVNAKDLNGSTPLGVALENTVKKPDMVMVLLKAGANVNVTDNNGYTPLILALGNKFPPEVITALLQAGAPPNDPNPNGMTALDYAKANPALKDTDALRQLQKASGQ